MRAIPNFPWRFFFFFSSKTSWRSDSVPYAARHDTSSQRFTRNSALTLHRPACDCRWSHFIPQGLLHFDQQDGLHSASLSGYPFFSHLTLLGVLQFENRAEILLACSQVLYYFPGRGYLGCPPVGQILGAPLPHDSPFLHHR